MFRASFSALFFIMFSLTGYPDGIEKEEGEKEVVSPLSFSLHSSVPFWDGIRTRWRRTEWGNLIISFTSRRFGAAQPRLSLSLSLFFSLYTVHLPFWLLSQFGLVLLALISPSIRHFLAMMTKLLLSSGSPFLWLLFFFFFLLFTWLEKE